jgi:HPt (histidine-containing phosphotransfer) domain-containing protein
MPEAEIIDQKTLAALLDSLGGDVDFLKELADAYLDSTPGLLDAMRQAAAAGDAAGLQRAAHTLKTGSANIGALALAALCKQLEDMGRAGELDGAEPRIDTAAAAYADVARALRDASGVSQMKVWSGVSRSIHPPLER